LPIPSSLTRLAAPTMAPATRAKGNAEANLIEIINNSPAKKRATEKKRKESERRAAAAAEKAAAKKAEKAKQSAKKTISTIELTDYSAYDKDTAILLKHSDAQIAFNASKVDQYSDTLAGFSHKKHPEAARLAKAKVVRYTEYVDTLRKARAQLIESSKPAKGKKKAVISDPMVLISSGELISCFFLASALSCRCYCPPFVRWHRSLASPIFYSFLFSTPPPFFFSSAYPYIITPGPTPPHPSSVLHLRPLLNPGAYHHSHTNGTPYGAYHRPLRCPPPPLWCLPPPLWCLPPPPR
jgi:hypothetical protein